MSKIEKFKSIYLGIHTAVEATALSPINGMLVYVSDTDSTFISVGFWGYSDSAWAKIDVTAITTKSYSFTSQGIGAGSYFAAGFYDLVAADANLTQANLTQTLGTANSAYAAHVLAVAGGAGVVDTGVVGLKVTGTRIEDDGTRTASYEDILSLDITTLSKNKYIEGVKFIGLVTYELYTVSGAPVNFSLDINYGFVKYEDFGNQNFILKGFEAVGLAGATDAAFDIELIHHKSSIWTFSAAAFTTPTPLYKMSTIYSTERSLINDEPFAFKRFPLTTAVIGAGEEGMIIKIVTTGNNSVQSMDMHIGVILI